MRANKKQSSSTSSSYKQKRTQSTSTRKKQTNNVKSKAFDPIDAFNVFTSDDLESIYSSRTSSSLFENITPLRKTGLNHFESTDSEDNDFLPKSQSIRKRTLSTRKTKSTRNKVPCLLTENKELTPPKTNPILLTPKKSACTPKENGPSTSSTLSKPIVEMKLNSPKKNSPTATQSKTKINVLSSTVIQKPANTALKLQEAGPSNGKKVSVCRNIFGAENSNKKEINIQTNINNNTILKDYDVNIRMSDKTLKGKLNISQEKHVISIDLIDENESMDTEESVYSGSETPKKSTKGKLIKTPEKSAKIVETPTKSPKKIKPKDTKSYTQSSMLNYMRKDKISPNKNVEIDKNHSKNIAVKTNSKYTLETNTRLYENVKNIIKWVFEKEYFSILFTKNETDILTDFFKFPDTKLTILCLRIFTRQHKWYNLTNLCTELNLVDESYNYHDVLTYLNENYVYSDYTDETLDILMDHLSASDLREICNSFKITAPTRKEAMLRKLLDYTSKQCTLTFVKNSDQILRERVEEKLGICIKLRTEFKNILYRIHLLYSLTHSFTSINDIYNMIYKIKSNAIKYPSVQTDSTKVFTDRQDFLNYAEATLLRKEYDDQFLKKDIGSQYLLCVEAHKCLLRLLNNPLQIEYDNLKPLFLRRFSASWVYCKVLTNGSLNLGKHYSEQVCEWLTDMLKQNTYCLYKRGQWYIQLSLIYQSHLKKFVEAADNIIAGINDKDVTEVSKYELSIRGSKMKQTKLPQLKFDDLQYALLPNITVPIERTFEAKAVYRNEQGRKLYFERITDEGKEYGSVEETAINYYTDNLNYTHGYHCEGQILTTLFIIFFWDILYEMNVPNTFITEIQNFPLDLFCTDFYVNRQTKINERLNNIRNNWNLEELCNFFSSKFSTHNLEIHSVVSFECDNEKTFHDIIKSIGKIVLAAVFERLAKDYNQFHSGLPDLFLWNNKEFKCAFVEVKSEKDTLSTKQILWINYLHNFHACVEVCHVWNKGSKKMKKTTGDQKI